MASWPVTDPVSSVWGRSPNKTSAVSGRGTWTNEHVQLSSNWVIPGVDITGQVGSRASLRGGPWERFMRTAEIQQPTLTGTTLPRL